MTTTVDVEISYFVEPPPAPGQNRSGKVVIQYRLIVNFTGTNRRTGRVVSGVATIIWGDGWFQDDGLKTTDLRDR